METTSCAIIPATVPDPYEIVALASGGEIDEDLEGSNNDIVELQEVHNVLATKRSDDPVPRVT